MATSQYWYFRFTHRFITDRAIQNMKKREKNGYEFIVIYLELCALSLPYGGYIEIPKTTTARSYALDLSYDIGEEPLLTADAISYLLEKGLVELLENDESVLLYIPAVNHNIGKSSLEADRVRQIEQDRRRQLGQHTDHQKEVAESKEAYGIFKNIYLTESEYIQLCKRCNKAESIVNTVSAYKKERGSVECTDYQLLIDYAEKAGLLRDNQSMLASDM